MRLTVLVPTLLALAVSCTKAPDATPTNVTPTNATPTSATPNATPTSATPNATPTNATPTPPPEEVPDVRATSADQACTADAECTLVPEDCCGCTSLGRQIGVRADRLASLAKRREPICAATSCAAAMSDDPTCGASKAVCRAGVCVPNTGAAPDATKTEPIPPG